MNDQSHQSPGGRRDRGDQSALDDASDRIALAVDQGAGRFFHRRHRLLLLRQADLQRAGLAVCLGGRSRELKIHLHGAAGIFHHPAETRAVRRSLCLLSGGGDADLHVRRARPVPQRTPRLPALSHRHADLFLSRFAGGLFRRHAHAGAFLARHATARQRWPAGNRAPAQGRRVSVADDVSGAWPSASPSNCR